jgi:hypothetical protein
LRQQIGIGTAEQIDVLEIYWPTTDKTDRFTAVPADQFFEVTEGTVKLRKLEWKPVPFPAPSPLKTAARLK